jgi:hypothetical protein
MPRSCSICAHRECPAIETALDDAIPLRTIADRWSVSKTALIRHKAHLSMRPTPTQRSAHRATGDDAPQALTMPREPLLFPEITHVKKRALLMAFVQTGSRVKAAHLAQMDDRMHWYWLKTDPIYCEAFERAEQMAGDRVEDRLYTLALEGTRKGVYHQGCGSARKTWSIPPSSRRRSMASRRSGIAIGSPKNTRCRPLWPR